MELPLAEVLELEVMRPARLLAGGARLVDRKVAGVAVIEQPVERFVERDQLVLTTAIGCGQDEGLFLSFMHEIFSAGAAALAVAVGRFVLEIPARAVEWAEERGFPLIELPWEVPFASIVRAVLERIIGQQLLLLQRSDLIHRSLTGVILEGGDLGSIARALAELVGGQVVVLDGRMRVLAASCELPEANVARQANAPTSLRPLKTSPVVGRRAFVLDQLPGYEAGSVVAAPIVAGGELFGYIGILAPEEREFAELEGHAIDHACAAAALYFLRERAVAQTELRLRGDFVWALASGRLRDDSAAASMARFLGYDLGRPHRAVVFDIDDFQRFLRVRNLAEAEVQRFKESIGSTVQEVVSGSGRQVMLTNQRDLYVCFVEELPEPCQGLNAVIRRVQEEVEKQHAGVSLSCGVGGCYPGTAGLARSFDEAYKAVEFGRVLRQKRWVGWFELLPALRVLLRVCNSEEASLLIDRFIEPLLKNDRSGDYELLKTVRVLMDTGWNISAAARHLHLHRQSLLYRLDRIRMLGEFDPNNSADRFACQLALYLHELREGRVPGQVVFVGNLPEEKEVTASQWLPATSGDTDGEPRLA